jgi:hypothetical protein
MAEDVAESVQGVQEVQNQLKVSPVSGGNGSSKHSENQAATSSSSSQKR